MRPSSSLEDRSALTGKHEGAQAPGPNRTHEQHPDDQNRNDGTQFQTAGRIDGTGHQDGQGPREPRDDADLGSNLGDSQDESDKDSMEDDPNIIVAQYRTEYRVKSVFKFNLQNVVIFIDGVHYFVKELKSQFEY